MALLLFNLFLAYGQSEKKYIRQGNGKYSDGKYPDSEISYRKALDKNKMSEDASFNLGDALYKQKKYDEAGKVFLDNSGTTVDNRKKADNFYNLGNSLLNNKKLEESINAYKNSLRLNPGNSEAKYNLAYAQDMLKRQQEQQKKDQNKDQNKENKDQNKDKKDQNKDNKDNKDQPKDQKKDENKDQKQDQQSISKEDAQRLLDALANDEKKVQEKVKQEKAARERVKTIINW